MENKLRDVKYNKLGIILYSSGYQTFIILLNMSLRNNSVIVQWSNVQLLT